MPTLYHATIGIPNWAQRPQAGLRLTYSKHAVSAARDEGLTRLPMVLPSDLSLVEVECHDKVTTKWLIRMTSRERPDCALVLAVMADGFVKTCWLNKLDDNHRTLDRSRYSRP